MKEIYAPASPTLRPTLPVRNVVALAGPKQTSVYTRR